MVHRTFWINKIEEAWKGRSVLWLSGVRRAGKTFLCKSIKDVEYFDCELPRHRMLMEDPQGFLEGFTKGKKVALDEIHRLRNPTELLKIAADYFPDIKILATGSSTLGASEKFKDTLTGRKRDIWLTPAISKDLECFKKPHLKHRFSKGGLPPFFLSEDIPEKDYSEWIDSFWARDIQGLFRLERRFSFQKFFELLMVQSGGIFEATKFTAPCEASRTTISNYLKVLEATYAVSILRPFSSRKATEIVSAPKVFGFDTGFICHFRGWNDLRPEDLGVMWEHYVLNEIQGQTQMRQVNYWRDKRGHEIDFIIKKTGPEIVAIECKWKEKNFNPQNIESFLLQYPASKVFVVCNDVERTFVRTILKHKVSFVSLDALIKKLVP